MSFDEEDRTHTRAHVRIAIFIVPRLDPWRGGRKEEQSFHCFFMLLQRQPARNRTSEREKASAELLPVRNHASRRDVRLYHRERICLVFGKAITLLSF